ncbi:RVP_2 domain-containing protein [Gossypium australe]|uniref:RVP_2 domain-containing protein n=1 Tax=Gossypium australe TaxID=47621 RepID=A0A5B6X2I1_9ROSI|nr:RVP_2 domain-containing protein [Gossypium australe]
MPELQCKPMLCGLVKRRCPLEIQNIFFSVDLLIMSFGDFYMILCMDWLIEYGVILDYRRKKFLI